MRNVAQSHDETLEGGRDDHDTLETGKEQLSSWFRSLRGRQLNMSLAELNEVVL